MGDSIDVLVLHLQSEFKCVCHYRTFCSLPYSHAGRFGYCPAFDQPHHGIFVHKTVAYEVFIQVNQPTVSVEIKQRPFWAERPVVARFSMSVFPGDLLVSHDVEVDERFRGRGIGEVLHKLRLECAKKAGFDSMVAIIYNDNSVEQHILTKNGWVRAINPPNPTLPKNSKRSVWVKYL